MTEQGDLEAFQEAYRRHRAEERGRMVQLFVICGFAVLILPCIALVIMRPSSILAIGGLTIIVVGGGIIFLRWYRGLRTVQARVVARRTLVQIGHGALVTAREAVKWRRRALTALLWLVLLVLSLGAYLLVDQRGPEGPSPAPSFVALAVLLLLHPFGQQLLALVQPTRRAPEDTLGWAVLRSAVLLALGGLVLLLETLLKQGAAGPQSRGEWQGLMAASVPVLTFLFHQIVMGLLPSWWVTSALNAGRYEQALRRVRFTRRLLPHDTPHVLLQSAILLFSARPVEAEALLVDRLGRYRWGTYREAAQLLENLGHALLNQGRYDQARRALEAAIEVAPQSGAPYCTLAALDLLQGQPARRALALAEWGLELASSSSVEKALSAERIGELQSVMLWALATLDRHADTEVVFQQTLKRVEHLGVFRRAQLHYRWGQVRALVGDRSGAREHYTQALTVDPHGHYGALAAAALERERRF